MAKPSGKLVIFGANGYVGSTVARKAVEAGLTVIGCSRSGQEPLRRRGSKPEDNIWTEKVEWFKVDALNRRDVEDFLDWHQDTTAVITSVGALTLDHKQARRTNGDANVNIAAAVWERPTIRRMVYVSAAVMKPADRVLKGYYVGKGLAETAMGEHVRGRAVALRPGMVNGTRIATSFGIPIPLWLAGTPMEVLFRPIWKITGLSLFTPPVHVDRLAEAALYSALQEPLAENDGDAPTAMQVVDYEGIYAKAGLWQPHVMLTDGVEPFTVPSDSVSPRPKDETVGPIAAKLPPLKSEAEAKEKKAGKLE